MGEEYQQAASASAGIGSGFSSLKDITGLYPHLKLNCSPQVLPLSLSLSCCNHKAYEATLFAPQDIQ